MLRGKQMEEVQMRLWQAEIDSAGVANEPEYTEQSEMCTRGEMAEDSKRDL